MWFVINGLISFAALVVLGKHISKQTKFYERPRKLNNTKFNIWE